MNYLASDAIAWNYNSKGLFSVGSFRKALEEDQEVSFSVPSFFWKGICPPKIEVFAWQLWRGRVMVKEVMSRCGMDNFPDLLCPICGAENETIDHIFLHCVWSKSLWLVCMSWWNVIGCHNFTVLEWMDGWSGLCPLPKMERIWCSLFYAVVWSIWETRNKLVFDGKTTNVDQAADMVKLRIVWWFKYLGKGSSDSVQSLLLNFKDACVELKKKKISRIQDWIPPPVDSLKFNVDGSSRGKPGPSGIGGVLRDSLGKILCLFSLAVGISDSISAELWAVKKATELCLSNPNLRGRSISVVSDSKAVVSWVNGSDFGNISLVHSVYEIRSNLNSFGQMEVVYDSRAFNSFADSLAKMGSNLCGDFVDWGDY